MNYRAWVRWSGAQLRAHASGWSSTSVLGFAMANPDYFAKFGQFIHWYANVERIVHYVFRHVSGLPQEAARTIDGGMSLSALVSLIRRIVIARKVADAERNELEFLFDHLGHITKLRDYLIHRGGDSFGEHIISTNYHIARSEVDFEYKRTQFERHPRCGPGLRTNVHAVWFVDGTGRRLVQETRRSRVANAAMALQTSPTKKTESARSETWPKIGQAMRSLEWDGPKTLRVNRVNSKGYSRPAPASELDDQGPAPDRPAEVAKGRSASELAAAKASEPNPTEELARHLENVCKLSLSKIEEILSLPTDSSNGNLLRATMSWTSPSRARRRWA
jgi:hypothetical protein